MPDNRAIFIRNKRHSQLTGITQRPDNELLRMAGVSHTLECRDSYDLDRSGIRWAFLANFHDV